MAVRKTFKISLGIAALFCATVFGVAYAVFPAFYKSTVKGFVKSNTDVLLQSLRSDMLLLQMSGGEDAGKLLDSRIFSMVWYEDAEFIFLPMRAKSESYELKLKKFFDKKYMLAWELHTFLGGHFACNDDFGLAPWFYTVDKENPADGNGWLEIAAVFIEYGKTSTPEFFRETVYSNSTVLEDGTVKNDGECGRVDKDVDTLREMFFNSGAEKIYASFEDNYDLKEFEWYKKGERPDGGLVYKNELVSLNIVRTGFFETYVIRDFMKRVMASRASYASDLDKIWRETAVETKGAPREKLAAIRGGLGAFNSRDAAEAPNLFRFIFDSIFSE